MQFRLVAVALLAAASITSTSLALATPSFLEAEPIQKVRHFQTHLRYTVDRNETLRPGSLVRDVSRHHNGGRVNVASGGRLTVVEGRVGRGAGYPAPCNTCRKAIIQAQDRASLDPRRRAFLFGVAVKASAFQARGDRNLVQKGFYKQAGGQYKLQMNDGVPGCVVRGSRGRVFATALTSVANGRWHRLDCRRTPRAVILRVDGHVVAKTLGRTGRIANNAPVRVGGRNLGADNDQYHGNLDNVFLRIRHLRP